MALAGEHFHAQRGRQLVIAIKVNVTANANVLDPHQSNHMIKVVKNIFNRNRLVQAHQLPYAADTHDSAGSGHSLNGCVTLVARVWIQGLAIGMGKQHRRFRHPAGIKRRPRATMREINCHTYIIHSVDYVSSVRRQTAVRNLAPTADRVVVVIRELRDALAQSVKEVDVIERAKMVGTLEA